MFFRQTLNIAQASALSALVFLTKYATARNPGTISVDSSSSASRDPIYDITAGVIAGVAFLACCAYCCCRNRPQEMDDEARTMMAFTRMREADPNP